MNLKQAASQLGVHYQTAYRWIRDGELVAVKIGNRYQISESAVEQFVNRRNDLLLAPSDLGSVAANSASSGVTTSDTADPNIPHALVDDEGLAEVAVLARASRLTAQPCFDAATALIATRVGDAAVMRLLDESATKLEPVSSFAAVPELRAQVASALTAAGGFDRSAPMWAAAEDAGSVNVVHHVPRDLIRQLFGAEGRFAGHGVDVLAAAVAPMFVDGLFVGGLLAVKTESHTPFAEDEIVLLEAVTELCSQAHFLSTAFRRTWRSNSELVLRAQDWVATNRSLSDNGLSDNGLSGDSLSDQPEARSGDANGFDASQYQLLDADRAQALLSPQGTVVVSTEKFVAATRRLSSRPDGFASYWQRGRTGELFDGIASQVEVEPLTSNGQGAIVSAVRRPDAELQLLAIDIVGL